MPAAKSKSSAPKRKTPAGAAPARRSPAHTMPQRRTRAHATPADTSEAVDAFMSTLQHPFKAEIEAIRKMILAVDAAIAEGVKWNAPSFRTTEYFATTNLRARKGIGIILHLGAKVRDLPTGGLVIDDPKRLLTWLAKDRAMIEFDSSVDLKSKKAAFQSILQQWILHV